MPTKLSFFNGSLMKTVDSLRFLWWLELVILWSWSITKSKYAPNTGLNMWCLPNQEIRCWQAFMHVTSSNHPCINKLAFITVCFQISLISYPDIHLLMKNLTSETGWKPNLYEFAMNFHMPIPDFYFSSISDC